jgi:hypothetical protein
MISWTTVVFPEPDPPATPMTIGGTIQGCAVGARPSSGRQAYYKARRTTERPFHRTCPVQWLTAESS